MAWALGVPSTSMHQLSHMAVLQGEKLHKRTGTPLYMVRATCSAPLDVMLLTLACADDLLPSDVHAPVLKMED